MLVAPGFGNTLAPGKLPPPPSATVKAAKNQQPPAPARNQLDAASPFLPPGASSALSTPDAQLLVAVEAQDEKGVVSALKAGASAKARKQLVLYARIRQAETQKPPVAQGGVAARRPTATAKGQAAQQQMQVPLKALEPAEPALALAIVSGNATIVRLLLEAGADPNAQIKWVLPKIEDWASLNVRKWDAGRWSPGKTYSSALAMALDSGLRYFNKPGAEVVLDSPRRYEDAVEPKELKPRLEVILILLNNGARIQSADIAAVRRLSDQPLAAELLKEIRNRPDDLLQAHDTALAQVIRLERTVKHLEERLRASARQPRAAVSYGRTLPPSKWATAVKRQLTCTTPYTPSQRDEVSLEGGNRVFVAVAFDDGWAQGFNMSTGELGFFPMACLTDMSVSGLSSPISPMSPGQGYAAGARRLGGDEDVHIPLRASSLEHLTAAGEAGSAVPKLVPPTRPTPGAGPGSMAPTRPPMPSLTITTTPPTPAVPAPNIHVTESPTTAQRMRDEAGLPPAAPERLPGSAPATAASPTTGTADLGVPTKGRAGLVQVAVVPQGKKEVVDAIRAMQAGETRLDLNDLDLDANDGKQVAEALKTNTTVRELYIHNNKLGDAGAEYIADALKTNTGLVSLWINKNKLGHKGVQALSEVLWENKTLVELNVRENKIRDQGAEYLAEMLRKNNTIETLRLAACEIGPKGATKIGEALKENTMLKHLALYGNEIGDDGVSAIAAALAVNQTLNHLRLYETGMGDKGAKAFAEVLPKNTGLNYLNLMKNSITPTAIYEITQALEESGNRTLKELYIRDNSNLAFG